MLSLQAEETTNKKHRIGSANDLDQAHTRYQIVSEEEQEDGSIIVRVRKQYNDKADVSEYFQ